MDFVIGDTHFGHKKIIEYTNRPFKDSDEMDKILINNWNQAVKKRDKIYILGDFSFWGIEETINLVRRLNGYKILIIGNHDKHKSNSWWIKKSGFDIVSPFPILYNEFCIFSHEPQLTTSNSPYVNVHAHVHDDPHFRDYSDLHFVTSVERKLMNYTPIKISKIEEIILEERKFYERSKTT